MTFLILLPNHAGAVRALAQTMAVAACLLMGGCEKEVVSLMRQHVAGATYYARLWDTQLAEELTARDHRGTILDQWADIARSGEMRRRVMDRMSAMKPEYKDYPLTIKAAAVPGTLLVRIWIEGPDDDVVQFLSAELQEMEEFAREVDRLDLEHPSKLITAVLDTEGAYLKALKQFHGALPDQMEEYKRKVEDASAAYKAAKGRLSSSVAARPLPQPVFTLVQRDD